MGFVRLSRVGIRILPLGRVNTGLRHGAHSVLVLPTLKLLQHLGCDLSLQGFRSGDERPLRDLRNIYF